MATSDEQRAASAIHAVNPATGEVIASYASLSDAGVEQALERAARTAREWQMSALDARAQLLRRVAALLRHRDERDRPFWRDDAELITREMGKPIIQARAEVEKCAWVCEYYAERGAEFLAPEVVETDAAESGVRFDPLGVVLGVMPWNFPFWQVFRFAAPAVMAGNVGLLKHASNVPGCSQRIEELFRFAGAPEGVFQSLLVGSGAVEGILRDDRVAAVTLTGSEAAGRSVASIAGSEIKTSVLELGGSDPFIVLADADLDAAVAGAVLARTQNAGQSCIAAKRFIVEAPYYDAFVERMAASFADLRVGDPMDLDTDIGPLARDEFVDELDDIVRRSLAAGARRLSGVTADRSRGYYYHPTLLVDCDPTMACFEEETFGPIAAVARAENVDHAIDLANATSFGLGASLWTDPARALALIPRIEAGHVSVNDIVRSDPRLPFGGIKRSGFGRELSRYGMLEFVNVKAYSIA